MLDFTNCMADRIGEHGLTSDALARSGAKITEITAQLERSSGTGWERWRLLPHDPVRASHVQSVQQLVQQYQDRTDNLVVLGIGGSALGNAAIHQALRPSTWNLLPHDQRGGPRLFVLDNVDPDLVGGVLDFLQKDDPGLRRTLFNVISKSGETAETAAQFLIVRNMLHRISGAAHTERIVAITDPAQGTMSAICDREGYARLPVPDGVGGRFSVLSPVGLFSAAMCGIDIDQLLRGAADMDARCRNPQLERNPAAMLATVLMQFTERGRGIHVMMPYANALYGLADWYRQLWAESLGKEQSLSGETVFAGATPVKALGATDQHSQVQLYREGPHDKVIGLIDVEAFGQDLIIPGDLNVDALRYLGGKSMTQLLRAERKATAYALTVSHRPNYTMHMPRITAEAVGAFIQLWQVATAYAGALLHIDPYNQPAVETGKQATFGLMGRDGYDIWRQNAGDMTSDPQRIV